MKADRNIFEISEQPVTLPFEASEDLSGIMETLEQDIRGMMLKIADMGLSRAELEKDNKKNLKEIFLSLIEVLDAFDRVFQSIHKKQDLVDKQMKKWIGNFRTIRRLVDRILLKHGVVIIENIDQRFDPRWHKASAILTDNSRPDEMIAEELVKGYLWNNKVLRKSQVVVIKNTENDLQGDNEECTAGNN